MHTALILYKATFYAMQTAQRLCQNGTSRFIVVSREANEKVP